MADVPAVKFHVSPRQFIRMQEASIRDKPIPMFGWYECSAEKKLEIERLAGTPLCPEIEVTVDWDNIYD